MIKQSIKKSKYERKNSKETKFLIQNKLALESLTDKEVKRNQATRHPN